MKTMLLKNVITLMKDLMVGSGQTTDLDLGLTA